VLGHVFPQPSLPAHLPEQFGVQTQAPATHVPRFPWLSTQARTLTGAVVHVPSELQTGSTQSDLPGQSLAAVHATHVLRAPHFLSPHTESSTHPTH
jgi:hypothetical protein